MRKGFLYLIIILHCSLASFGQSSPTDTLFIINKTAYSSNTFINLYQNNKLLGENNHPIPLRDALNLYINFHLKVAEAKRLQLDTLPEVKKEVESYHNLVFDKHLYPVTIDDELIQETFERIQHFVKSRHILIKIKGRGMPKDTLEAYQKACKIYSQLKSGKRFEKLANQHSDDLLVRKNHGELEYFTVFDMDYAFETAAYNTPPGKFSEPVRTAYGYHIVQRLGKIKNPGKVRIRHLMLEFDKKSGADKTKQKADSIYRLLQNGANFSELIQKYSDDINSVPNDGILPWFGLFETHSAIENNAFQLKTKNEYSAPIKTEFGYHIIQLLDKREYNNPEDCRNELILLLSEDKRSRISESQLIKILKQKYQFKENKKLLSNFYSILDYAYAELWETLFTIGGHEYSQEAFADFLSKQESKDIYENFKEYINRLYVSFSNNSILAFHKNKLVNNNAELKSLLREYENGVLVYFMTKNKIWDHAKNEHALFKYFSQHSEKYKTNVDFESVRSTVLSDFRKELEENWLKQLRSKFTVTIQESTFSKIANIKNE